MSSATLPPPHDAPPTPPVVAPAGACTNCGAERVDAYCGTCGQHALDGGRLTPRSLWRAFSQRFLHLERGLFLTVRELTTNPGGVIGRYLAGQRRRYVNPLGFLVMAVAFNLAVHSLSGYEDRVLPQMLDGAEVTDLGMQFDQGMRDFVHWSFQHLSLLSVVVCVFFAGFMRLFLGRDKMNMAEGLVFGLFCYGQMTILSTLLEIPYIFAPNLPYSLQVETALDFGLLFVLILFAAWGLFRRAAPTVLTALSLAAGFLVYFALQFVVMISFLLVTMLSSGEREWTLHEAVAQNRASIVVSLLDAGADPNAVTGQTALHRAAEEGHLAIVDLLLARGADPNRRDGEGQTPLLAALHLGHTTIADRLLDAGADPALADTSGLTPLMEAVTHKHEAVARRLLGAGADPNALRPGKELATALMIAADKRRSGPAYVALLLDAGADPMLTNEEGQTAFDLAKHEESRVLLREAARL